MAVERPVIDTYIEINDNRIIDYKIALQVCFMYVSKAQPNEGGYLEIGPLHCSGDSGFDFSIFN